MTQVEKTQPLPIVYSSTFLRRPLSRSCAYVPKNERKFYQNLGTVSIGQIIGGVIAITGFGSFLNDLLRNWGEGGFWRRLGMFAVGAFGVIEAATTKTIDDLFTTDLISSGALDISKKFNDKDAQELAQDAFDKNKDLIKNLINKISLSNTNMYENLVLLMPKVNEILKPFNLEIDFSFDRKKGLVETYICSTLQYHHQSGRPDKEYKPFLIAPMSTGNLSIFLQELFNRIENNGIARFVDSNDELVALIDNVLFLTKGGLFEFKEGIKSKPEIMNLTFGELIKSSSKLFKQFSGYLKNLYTSTVKREDVKLASEAPELDVISS